MTDPVRDLIEKAQALVDSITFDESGINGRGGNGGLISRETFRTTGEVRLAIHAAKKSLQPSEA